ncbi:diguanylate cyclase [Rhodopseudomonas palustris HaA2]|uniref:diguanylate cyclase n=1 Tax=Rhodopseudomonas palustris (strain HaA2) TaxID=316058 RepID=Q2IZF7_RHOP2|nr:sensor domain-containing diguanylate cyclase [Rhodopseudomonas palustris]ABD06403.1 diguanylate cyclase [Rhodopseudomonas palustris HaA2]
MASYLETQLDFIYFFYGLAFILLGAMSFVIARVRPNLRDARLIGLFGCSHGVTEWMDMTTLIFGDSNEFAIFRSAMMTLSFIPLAEFARRGAVKLGVWMPGAWIYLPVLGVLGVVGHVDGLDAARALARYALCAPGALGTGLVMLARRHKVREAGWSIAVGLAIAFSLYGLAAGVVVEPAPFWPATIVNQAWFVGATGVPIQLVRGLIALVLAALIWGAWGRRLIHAFDCPRYTAYLQRQFYSVLAAMAAILIFGWVLTNILGGIFRTEVEREAASTASLLVNSIADAVGTADAVVRVLAASPVIAPLLVSPERANRDLARAVIDLHVETAGASRGFILDRNGHIVETTDRHDFDVLGAASHKTTVWFQSSIGGRTGRNLQIDPFSGRQSYVSSLPLHDPAGSIIGVVALEVLLEKLDARLRGFEQAFFLLDARDVVVLTSRPAQLSRTLWPRPDMVPAAPEQPSSTPHSEPLRHAVTGGEWTRFGGRRSYVLRSVVEGTPWSVVLTLPVAGITASRLLGIIITLQLALTALFYFFGRERGVRDRVQQLLRSELQERAAALARQATTDPLTGLHNRLRFNEGLAQELARVRRTGQPLSLVMFDVDHFKEVNDRYGHPTGDQVLIRLSQTAAAQLRQTDLLARWGGEEFAILLVDADLHAAVEVAENLRRLVARTPFDQIGSVTASFGVAECRPDESADSLLERADAALYRAKSNGRNRVEIDAPVIEETVALSPAESGDEPQQRSDHKKPTRA